MHETHWQMTTNKNTTKQTWLVYFLFFWSGAAALIYEISWSRQIGLLFGHTVHASSIVLASYFSGMAIGYWLGARWSRRVSPLVGYGIAEITVAAWAFAIPALIGISEAETFASWLSSSSFVWQTCIRAIFSFLLLLPATIALGFTLPMMAEYFSKNHGNDKNHDNETAASVRISFAYALNTAGALAGVLLATFYLLVFVGVCSSSYIAAAITTSCAMGAFLLQSGDFKTGNREENLGIRKGPVQASSILRPQLLILSFLSGFGTLALQVLYTRMFSLVFHNSTYTFGIIVAVFLASLAISAGLASGLQTKFNCRKLMGVTAALGGIVTAASIIRFVDMTELDYFTYGDNFSAYISGAIVLVAVIVAPSIICLGMLLPLVWTDAGSGDNAGRVVGTMTAVNTIAAAFGALFASFFMLPVIGLWPSITLIGFLFFIAGFCLLWNEKWRAPALLSAILFGVVSVFAISSPTESENSRTRYEEQLIQRWNSAYGWIDLVKHNTSGGFKIRQNLHYRFGKTGNNAREYRQAQIPILLHENPDDVLFMGLGTGLTAGGAVPHPEVENITVVELIPEVVEAARVLAEHNNNVVDHPKVEVHIDDARHQMLASQRQYDVIVSDLFVPWESQSGYLYTVEHYQVAKSRLKENGMFCQWLPLYQVSQTEFELIANSLSSVFPNTTIWWGELSSSFPVIALIGTQSPINFDSSRIETRISQLKQHVDSVDPSIATPELILDLYAGDWKFQVSARLNTDEHPRVEFLTPISHRNRKLLYGKVLEQYYDHSLSMMAGDSVAVSGSEQYESHNRRRTLQQLILFGDKFWGRKRSTTWPTRRGLAPGK